MSNLNHIHRYLDKHQWSILINFPKSQCHLAICPCGDMAYWNGANYEQLNPVWMEPRRPQLWWDDTTADMVYKHIANIPPGYWPKRI